MATAVRLTVLTGPHKNRKFCFCGPNQCHIGRELDCFVQFSGTQRDKLISRRHCRLEIDPPSVQVWDLGSRNGTYVNGKEVESTIEALSERAGAPIDDGDVLTLGGTTLQVNIVECPHAENTAQGTAVWHDGTTVRKDCGLVC